MDTIYVKDGNIKVDNAELLNLIRGYNRIYEHLFNNLDILSTDEKQEMLDNYEYLKSFYNKYVLSSHLRRLQHLWFEMLKKIDTNNFNKIENVSPNANAQIGDYIKAIKLDIEDAQELSPRIDSILGLAITLFGIDLVRSEILANYLEIKKQREDISKTYSSLISD